MRGRPTVFSSHRLKTMQITTAFLMILTVVGQSREQEQASLKARIAAAHQRHQRALEQYRHDLLAADDSAVALYKEERHRDLSDLLDQAEMVPNDTAAVPAIQFVIDADHEGFIGVQDRAIGLLAREHAQRPGFGQYCRFLAMRYYSPAVDPFIRAVLAKHPDRKDRAGACLALADMLRIKAHWARHFRAYPEQIKSSKDEHGATAIARFLREADPDGVKKEAEAAYERVARDFGDVRLADSDRTLGEIASGELNALRNLNIGQVAPDIEAVDVDGRQFKLSDYRGKVVVLVFSGEWYPGTTAMYASQRALLERYAGRPVAIVDVNTAISPDKLRASIKAGEVTWRCMWDGGPSGPIATHWAIKSYPSVFVIDVKGVIRFENIRDEALDHAVRELLAKANR